MIKKVKHFLLNFPEHYFVLVAIIAGYTPPFSVNPIFIGLAAILLLQILFKNRKTGLILGCLFFLINIAFFGALISEFIEFTTFNSSAQQLLIVGLSLWVVNSLFSLGMLSKYLDLEVERISKLKYDHQ